jgi:type III secretion protein V
MNPALYRAAILPTAIIGVVAIILVPLPTFVIDFLLGVSLAMALALLVLSMHVERTLQLSTFPSLLLISTLLRLALSIASTKLILLHAHAGQIIEAFGKLVVGGNVVVGLVVFIIITLVQFIVIAKGSERVAEVGARFTLDSMPGKQMSIEADLRGGMMKVDEARMRRQDLDQESQFHGAMDGAMKFVKGDAIATVLIALVNIGAGLGIGVGVNGMSFGDALSRYTILTVGDGMVAQLPSLITSVAAGILITRVSGAAGVRLSDDIQRQLMAQPLVLLLIGAVLLLTALLPGLPHLPLGLLGAMVSSAGWFAYRRQSAEAEQARGALTEEEVEQAWVEVEVKMPQFSPPLWIAISPSMANWFDVPWASHELLRARMRMNRLCGLPLPRVRGDTYVAYVYDFATGAVSIPGGCYARRGARADEPGSIRADIPCLGPIVWVPAGQVQDASEARWWNVYRMISEHLEAVAMAHAERLLGLEETHQMITRMEREMPELAREAIKASPLPRTADVLRTLAREGVSMRNMRAILESLVNWAGRERDNDLLAELVRVDLGAVITQRFVDASKVFRPLTVAPDFETSLVGMVVAAPKGPVLAPPQDVRQALHAALSQQLAAIAPDGQGVPILCSSELRRHLAAYLALQFPQVRVFAYDELDRRLSIEPLGVISPSR